MYAGEEGWVGKSQGGQGPFMRELNAIFSFRLSRDGVILDS